LPAPGPTAEDRLVSLQGFEIPFGIADPHPFEPLCRLTDLEHLNAFLEAHPQVDAGALEGAHQLAAVVDLTVLGEQQARLPARPDPGNFLFQLLAVQRCAPAGGGIHIPLCC